MFQTVIYVDVGSIISVKVLLIIICNPILFSWKFQAKQKIKRRDIQTN